MRQPIRHLLTLFAFSLFLPLVAAAQTGTIEGTVIDGDTDDSLPGVQVFIPDLNAGTVTDINGAYTIPSVPAGTYEVEARFVGFRTVTQEVEVSSGETATADFTLTPSSIDLDEVVVTGTGGPVEKRKLGNTISTISTADLENAPIQSFSDLIQGREPGVAALPSGGLTGEGTRIRIRGSASLSQSNEPLIYIDGIRSSNGGGFGAAAGGFVDAGGGGAPSRLDDIPPEAIARVEVLKGAAAATLFGTEASNGVIQVFTKRGTSGPPQFTFTSKQTAIRYPNVYPNNAGFAQSADEVENISEVLSRDVTVNEVFEENFTEDLLGTGFAQEYSGSVRGGGDTELGGVTYFISGRFLTEDGPFTGNPGIMPEGASTLANDEVTRATGLANIEILPSDKLRLRVTTGYFTTNFETLQTNNNIYGTISLAQFSKPELVAPDNETGTIAFATVAESVQQETSQNSRHFNGSFNLNYSPLEWMTLDGIFGLDFVSTTSEELRPFGWNVDGFAGAETDGAKRFTTINGLEYTVDAKAKAVNQISELFESDLTVGVQGFISQSTLESGEGVGFPGPGFEISSAAAQQSLFESFSEVVNAGVFAQEQVGYNDFLFVTVGARYDVNSAFGSDFSGVFYPKVSASIIPSDAPFWNGPIGPLSSVRFRAALGQSGLQPGAFDALTTFESLNAPSGAGIVPSNLGNPSLKPEISTEWELGTEIGLFEDRSALEVTYWDRTVSDALVARQFPVSGGFRATQLVNIGELKGRGVEISARALVVNNDNISLDVFANGSYLWEQVTDLGGAPPIKVGGSYTRYRNYLTEGYAPGSHFGVRLQDVPEGSLPVDLDGDGSADTRQEVVSFLDGDGGEEGFSLPQSTRQVLLAQRAAGACEGGANANCPTGIDTEFFLGKPTPDWQGAFGFDLDFLDNFTLGTLFEYKAGNFYINNLTDAFRQANPSIGRNLPESARAERDYITGGVDAQGNPQNSGEVRTQALETWLNELLALEPFAGLNTIKQADFVRWRELSLTYNVPTQFVERFGGRRLSFTISGRNLALWTKYDGVDPELNAVGRGGGNESSQSLSQLSNNFLDGVEAFGFPIPRRIGFQVRLGF
jgi:TonB-linked SusC/RagA family outer membrane protein